MAGLGAVALTLALVSPTAHAEELPGKSVDVAPGADFKAQAALEPLPANVRRSPRDVALRSRLTFGTPVHDEDGPRLIGLTVLLPRGLAFHGDRYPTCTQRTIRRHGAKECPLRSVVGTGGGSFGVPPQDPYATRPNVVYVNGRGARIWAFTTIYTPVVVQAAMHIDMRRLRHRHWGYRLRLRVPTVLRFVGSTPVRFSGLDLNLGGRRYAPSYVTLDRACPRWGSLPYRAFARFRLNDGSVATRARTMRIRCSPRGRR